MGRKIGLRQPKFTDEFRIVEVLGPELSRNQTYMDMLNPLLFIAEIDGIVQPFPTTKIAVDSLITTAGREGFLAVTEWMDEALPGRRRRNGGASKKRARHPGLKHRLWLVKNGVPYDVAFSLSKTDATAYGIIMGEFEGGEFDYHCMSWKDKK